MFFKKKETIFLPFNRIEQEAIKERTNLINKYLSHYFKYVESCEIKDFMLLNLKKSEDNRNFIELMIIFLDKTNSKILINKTKRAISYFYNNIDIKENKNCLLFDIDNFKISLAVV